MRRKTDEYMCSCFANLNPKDGLDTLVLVFYG